MARVQAQIDSFPAAKKMTKAQRNRVALETYLAGDELLRYDAYDRSPGTQPNWSVTLGIYIYINSLSNSDQRFFAEIGTGGLAIALDAATGGSLTPIIGAVAVVIGAAISEYFNPDPNQCLSLELNWVPVSLHSYYYTPAPC